MINTIDEYSFNILPVEIIWYTSDFHWNVFADDPNVMKRTLEYELNFISEIKLLLEAKVKHRPIKWSKRTESILKLTPEDISSMSFNPVLDLIPESEPPTPKSKEKSKKQSSPLKTS